MNLVQVLLDSNEPARRFNQQNFFCPTCKGVQCREENLPTLNYRRPKTIRRKKPIRGLSKLSTQLNTPHLYRSPSKKDPPR